MTPHCEVAIRPGCSVLADAGTRAAPGSGGAHQVWGTAWQEAQGQLTGEREALGRARRDLEQKRAEMLAEIGKLDGELEALREELRQGREALEAERQAHEQMKSEAREARVLAEEREKRIAALEAERDREREGRGQTQAALNALRIEAATLAERAAHVEELRALVAMLRERRDGAG